MSPDKGLTRRGFFREAATVGAGALLAGVLARSAQASSPDTGIHGLDREAQDIPTLARLARENGALFARVTREAKAVLEGGRSDYREVIVFNHSQEGAFGGGRINRLSVSRVADEIAWYVRNIEENWPLRRMFEETSARVVPVLKRFDDETLQPGDFVGNSVPSLFPRPMAAIIFATKFEGGRYSTFGGGYAGNIRTGEKVILFGPYDDQEVIRLCGAKESFGQVLVHEAYVHGWLQQMSVPYSHLSGEYNRDPQMMLLHNAMGFHEFVGCLANDVTTYFPNERIMLFAEVLKTRGGMKTADVVKAMANLAVHGDRGGALTKLYEEDRGDDHLPFSRLMMDNFVPQTPNRDVAKAILSATAEMAGLSTANLSYGIQKSSFSGGVQAAQELTPVQRASSTIAGTSDSGTLHVCY